MQNTTLLSILYSNGQWIVNVVIDPSIGPLSPIFGIRDVRENHT